ncbi:LexA family protein [Gluconobacter roseus]|uniref:LexA family protein n=1 Tax=Gluconobacter roseus TaxID=586239 RepID=UPI0038CFCD40
MERHPSAAIIEQMMKAQNTNPKRLAKEAGVGPTYVRDIIEGRSLDPKTGKLTQIATALGCKLDDLLGKGASVTPIHTTQIEVRGDVQAGVWREAIEWPAVDWYAITVPIDTAYQGFHRYGLKVCGQSMNKVFPEGSVVVVINFGDLGRLPKTGDFVVAVQRCSKTDQYEATVKAVQIRDDGTVILWPQSWDPAFQTPVVLPPQDGHDHAGVPEVAIQALVVGSYQANPKASFS